MSGRVVKVVSSPIFSAAASNGSTPGLASVPATFVSVVAFTQPPSSAPRLAASLTTSGGLHCVEHALARISAETGGRVTASGFSTAATRTSLAGTPVSEIALSFAEGVSSGSVAEHVAVRERLAVFAKGGALVELTGVNLPPSDAGLFRTILARLVSRA